MNTQEQIALKAALERQEMSWEAALTQLTQNPTKPWDTAEWATLRERLLVDQCQQCGSDEPPLVLQHLWHPKPFKVLYDLIRQPIYDAYRHTAQRNHAGQATEGV